MLTEDIARRRAGPEIGREDILSMLLAATYEDGSQIDDRELREELRTLLVAGHETTATAVCWALFELHRHPEALERLIATVRALARQRRPRSSLSYRTWMLCATRRYDCIRRCRSFFVG